MSFKTELQQKIPQRLQGLIDLAYNYWWTWSSNGEKVFSIIDPILWEENDKNPIKFLLSVEESSFEKILTNKTALKRYDRVLDEFTKYMNRTSDSTLLDITPPKQIGYLCAEYGIHRSLPIYSGGLGVLAGDHLKEASDLALNFHAVGLLYSEGYFIQRLSTTGDQTEEYEQFNPVDSPLIPLTDGNGAPLLLKIPIGQHEVFVKVWHVKVGKSNLYLFDTNIPENLPEDRTITQRLYQGDRHLRIRQEIVLGIGGIRLFNLLGLNLDVIHLNEGHTAFAGIEILLQYLKQGLSFSEAREKTRQRLVFTTHTPVPAGHDVFSDTLVLETLGSYTSSNGLANHILLELGRSPTSPGNYFNMTVLAMNLSRIVNGVSKLNAQVMNKMFQDYFKSTSHIKEIIPITNGVHMPTWIHPLMQQLYTKYLGEHWIDNIDKQELWENIDILIPDEELWKVHTLIKKSLYLYNQERTRREIAANALDTSLVYSSGIMIDPNVLTIGFARRFAAYKRAPLIFSDPERLRKILTNPYRPVQLIFAGKAHPDDSYGKSFLRTVTQYAQDPRFQGRIAFVQDYGIELAKHLVAGVDVWLNNPRLPREASGTSGEKAAANGVVNLSTADGWWREGYNKKNGWVIGTFDLDLSDEERDKLDAESLYNILEKDIIPRYYNNHQNGYSPSWTEIMKESIKSTIWKFNTKRMLKDYLQKMYLKPV